jgi:guanosine-3',5'-bis(diphosphate) 3'-pyrophosphohydrolase
MKRLLMAVEFASRKHARQKRKNAEGSPYINQPIQVAALANVGEVDDEDILIAASLHDTIEDTGTTEEEITSAFGKRVSSLVSACTNDKRL